MKEYQSFSDDDLLLMSADGDQIAEEELVERYKRKVAVCSRKYYLFGGDNDDLLQEGMLGLLKAIRTYKPGKGASFNTYAEVCIRSKLLDAVSFKRYTEFLSLDETDLDESSFCANDPETMLIENERDEEFLLRIKSLLSPYESKVLDLYLQGLNCTELAENLNKSVTSVYNAVQRIRSKLAQALS